MPTFHVCIKFFLKSLCVEKFLWLPHILSVPKCLCYWWFILVTPTAPFAKLYLVICQAWWLLLCVAVWKPQTALAEESNGGANVPAERVARLRRRRQRCAPVQARRPGERSRQWELGVCSRDVSSGKTRGEIPWNIFSPLVPTQIYGDNENIFGYRGLKISLFMTSSSLRSYVHVEYDEKVNGWLKISRWQFCALKKALKKVL